MSDRDFRDFVYVSDNKVEQYLGQMDPASLSKVSSETKFKAALVEHTVKAEFERAAPNRYANLQTVVAEIERRGLVGSLLDYTPWFHDRVSVKALLVRDKVFYVGRISAGSVLSVNYAFQCSLAHHVGMTSEKRTILEDASSHGLDQNFELGRITATLPGVTSSNSKFADSLSSASSSIQEAEPLLQARERDDSHFARFFSSKSDADAYLANRPSDYEFSLANKYLNWNDDFYNLTRGWFRGYRDGLLSPPSFSLIQSIRNAFGNRPLRRAVGEDSFGPKLVALKKLYNLRTILRRLTSDAESRILNEIAAVSAVESDTTIEIFGHRLLDGYYRRERSSEEQRVILGTPLYIA